MKVKFTPSARKQFLGAIEYIRMNKPDAAQQFRNKAEKSLRSLNKFPYSGRVLPEFPGLTYREIIVSPYRFFYRVEKNIVWIVAVWHGSQLPDRSAG